MSTLDVNAIKLGALQTSSKGAKQVPLFLNNDTSIFTQLGPLSVQYEPSAFGDPAASRVNLVLSTNELVEKTLSELDARVISLLAADSAKYFGTALSESQILERMQPSIRVSEKGYKSCRMKMNITGRNRVQLFGMDKTPCEPPETWVGSNVTVRMLVKSVWLMNKEWGVLFEAQAVQVETSAVECPF
jgi:hypothetical protein